MNAPYQGETTPAVKSPELGLLIPGTTSVALQGRKTWRYGLVKVRDGGQHAVFVCQCEWRELIVQVLVSCISRSLGVPCPDCFIVAANKRSFPETDSEKTVYLFGFRATSHPTLAMFSERMDEAADLLLTARKEVTNRLIILDEWAINGRRNETSLFIDPASGLLFVDNHPALPDGHGPGDQIANWAHEITHGAALELERTRLRKEIERSANHIFDIPLSTMADEHLYWLAPEHRSVWYSMLDYLKDRRHALETLFCTRLGIPEQQLQFTP